MSKLKKFSVEYKLEVVQRCLEGSTSIADLSREYSIARSAVQTWRDAYLVHGIKGLFPTQGTYSGDFKAAVVEYKKKTGASLRQTAAHFHIANLQSIGTWERLYNEKGISALYMQRKGRKKVMKERKPRKDLSTDSEKEELLAEIEWCQNGECVFKKIESLSSGTNCPGKQERAAIINELRPEYRLADLLELDGMPRSSFYYHLKKMKQPEKYAEEKEVIEHIYHENKGRYGYRRITMEMHNRGYTINHKTVQKLMKQSGLKCEIRKRRYRSYKGERGKTADNKLNRNFKADKPEQKWVTDVTEFRVGEDKVYLSPILDLFNGEIISYSISLHPTFRQIMDMLDRAFEKTGKCTGLILHSDQGWQYQMKRYQFRLKEKGIVQSMSRKGNCLDNSVMENFFGLLKTEMYYKHEFKSAEHLIKEIEEYIDYYNNRRIKAKLKGLSPVQYRIQSSPVA